MTSPLLAVEHLTKHYRTGGFLAGSRGVVRAVDGVSLTIAAGETLGIVGESGSGKSTLARTLLRLEEPTSGTVHFQGVDLAALSAAELRRTRRHMQIVFQDPATSLNPRRTLAASISEGLQIHRVVPPAEIPQRVAALLQEVGLDPALGQRLPHEVSGGQRQRVGIARALALSPRLVVCDEPVSALDVSVQAQVLNLLLDLRDRHQLAYLFIAHDLAVVATIAHRIAVMYLGTIVEVGPARPVIQAPLHPYTQALVSAIPDPDPTRQAQRIVLTGEPPSPAAPPPGCPFAPRCFHPAKDARCTIERPALRAVDDREVACHHATSPG